jgi:hypothetical protein
MIFKLDVAHKPRRAIKGYLEVALHVAIAVGFYIPGSLLVSSSIKIRHSSKT